MKRTAPGMWSGSEFLLRNIGLRGWRLGEGVCKGDLPEVVVLAGVAGALDAKLKVGDVVVDPPAGVHCAEGILATAQEKTAAFARTGCAAVDMESGPVRAYWGERGVDVVCIRAISDAATDALDPAMLSLIDQDGRPKVGRAIGWLGRHPGRLGELLKLRRNTAVALEAMGRAVAQFASDFRGSATARPGRP